MMLDGKRVLVTGGAGFVPSHVAEACQAAGARVTVLDNFAAGSRANLEGLSGGSELVEMDVRDEAIETVVKRQDVVIHMSANADVPLSVRDPGYDFDNNVIGGYNVLRACLNSDIQKFIFASSAAVYGEPAYTPMDEAHPTNPASPYGAAKLSVEKLGFAYFKTFGLPFTAVRIFNTYGVRQSRYVMYDLLRKLHDDPTRLEVLGSGEQIRDYSYVTDTARCFVLVAESDDAIGEAYNVAGGEPIRIRDLADRLIATVGLKDVDVVFTGESWPGDIATLVADISKVRRLGFEPGVRLETGVSLLASWLERQWR